MYVISNRDLTKDYWLSYSKIENLKQKNKIKHSIVKKILHKYLKKKGLEVHTISEVPSNSGLGSSGALSVGLIQCLMHHSKKTISTKDLAEKAVNIEMQLNKKQQEKNKINMQAHMVVYLNFLLIKKVKHLLKN